VIAYLGAEKPTDTVTVPNVVGMSVDSAEKTLANAGLYMKTVGASSGSSYSAVLAISQSVAADSEVDRGTVVEVRFTDRTMVD
jgi:stage V sporulation protein D (sporulation-specific penicillin-binding protein)